MHCLCRGKEFGEVQIWRRNIANTLHQASSIQFTVVKRFRSRPPTSSNRTEPSHLTYSVCVALSFLQPLCSPLCPAVLYPTSESGIGARAWEKKGSTAKTPPAATGIKPYHVGSRGSVIVFRNLGSQFSRFACPGWVGLVLLCSQRICVGVRTRAQGKDRVDRTYCVEINFFYLAVPGGCDFKWTGSLGRNRGRGDLCERIYASRRREGEGDGGGLST